MELINVDNNLVRPRYDNWRTTAQQFWPMAQALPQVASGAVTTQQAGKWLATACKLHQPAAVGLHLQQASGLGAKDIRALIAHHRDEYYPEYAASEVYKKKFLQAVQVPDGPSLERERVLTNIVRSLLIKRYGLNRDIDIEKKMALPNPNGRAPWLIGHPGMVASHNKQSFLYDIQFDSETDKFKHNDLIRLHYYDLVASNCGMTPQHLNLVKVKVAPEFADALIALSGLSKNAEQAIASLAGDLSSLPEDKLKIEVHPIQKQPELYHEITQTGHENWRRILSGIEPDIKQDPPLELSNERLKLYTEAAKTFLAAEQVYKAADIHRSTAKQEFFKSMSGVDISDNFRPPYLGALFRKKEELNLLAVVELMEEKLNIDPAHLRSKQINTDLLIQEFKRMGGNPEQFMELGDPDVKTVETVAEQIGLDLTAYYDREMRAFINPKTRGPIHEAMLKIRNSVLPALTALATKTAQSPLLDNEALHPEPVEPAPRQTAMRM